jgi:hypothetical protein
MTLVRVTYAIVGLVVLCFALGNAIAMMWSPKKLSTFVAWYTRNPEWRFPWSVEAAELRVAGFVVGIIATFLLVEMVGKVADFLR